MFTEKCKLNIKTMRYNNVCDDYSDLSLAEYKNMDFKKLKSTSILGLVNNDLNYYSPSYVSTMVLNKEFAVNKLTFINTKGTIREVTCCFKQNIFTCVRPYHFNNTITANKISKPIDVFLDEEGFLNKLLSSETVTLTEGQLYSIECKYPNSTYFVNGILFCN